MLLFGASVIPPVVSAGADDEAVSSCEAYIGQVSRVAKKPFVFALKTDHITYYPAGVFETTVKRWICEDRRTYIYTMNIYI